MSICYYLLYRLTDCSKIWIVDIMDIPDDFYNFIKKIKSEYETYYLVYKFVSNIEKELNIQRCKRFRIFEDEYEDNIRLIAKSE